MSITITLTPEELQKCKDFSKQSSYSQQAIEFGQDDTAARSPKEIARDNLIGKMAEVAFAKMLKEKFDIDVDVDFGVYERGKWDDNDIIINGWNIDIKSTRKGHWLLIEWNKLIFRQKQGELPHAFFMCRTPWNRDDTPQGTVELIGCISLPKLKAGEKNIVTIRKGQPLPGTSTLMQADNFGVEFRHLNDDWNAIIPFMLHNPPPDLSTYPNPETGETLPQYTHSQSISSKNAKPTKTLLQKILSFLKF